MPLPKTEGKDGYSTITRTFYPCHPHWKGRQTNLRPYELFFFFSSQKQLQSAKLITLHDAARLSAPTTPAHPPAWQHRPW